MTDYQNKSITYAVLFRNNWDGEGNLEYVFASLNANNEWINIDDGMPLIEYEGDEILQSWPLTSATAAHAQSEGSLAVVTRTAPERIYLQISDYSDDGDQPFPSDHGNVTWCADSVLACEVAYVRADLAAAAQPVEARRQAAEPYAWHVECQDPDYSRLCFEQEEAESHESDHAGEIIPVFTRPVSSTVTMPDAWRKTLSQLVSAMRAYEMDAEGPRPDMHRRMMARAESLLNAIPFAADERAQGIKQAAALLQRKSDDFAAERGSYDPDTGATEFRGAAEEYHSTLIELADEIAALASEPDIPFDGSVILKRTEKGDAALVSKGGL